MQRNSRSYDKYMKLFLKLTDKVIRQNLRQLVLFTLLYRLVAGIFYIKTVNGILKFSLNMAGYSYLTIGNLRAFLLRPVTIFAVVFILFFWNGIFAHRNRSHDNGVPFFCLCKKD